MDESQTTADTLAAVETHVPARLPQDWLDVLVTKATAFVPHLDERDEDPCPCGIEQVPAHAAKLLKLFDNWYGDKSYRKHEEIVAADRDWPDGLALIAEICRLRRRLQMEDHSHGITIEQRDHAESAADKLAELAAQLTCTDIGEHSNANDPWGNAANALQQAIAASHARGRTPEVPS